MGYINYKPDALAIQEQQESRVAEAVTVLEQMIAVKPLQFIKDNSANKKLRERLTEVDIKMLLGAVLVKASALAGVKTEIDRFTADDITRFYTTYHADLTVEEVAKMYELERYLEYPEKTEHYNLFDVNYASAITKKYKEWKRTMKMQHNIISKSDEAAEIGEAEQLSIVNSGILKKLEHFKATGEIESPHSHIFDALYERNIIKKPDTPELVSYYAKRTQMAQEQLKVEYSQMSSAVKSERTQIKEELIRISQGTSTKIEVYAKKIVLQELFKHWILNEVDVVELIGVK